MTKQESYMRRALELAEQGRGYTAPNPMVGCVIVKDDRIISEGYHERCGEFHAERNALLNCKEDPAGADLYVTLEPCCHYGKTPPCTEIIIEKKIGRVYVGSMDCNPQVAGKGVAILREHGIEVTTGILEEECLRLNEVFYHYMRTKSPFVVAKYAMTLDGKIACESGDAKWVSCEESRNEVQLLRKYYTGIMVGIGTVLADDPMLNCRIEEGVNPIRIICDSKMRIPIESKIVQTASTIPTILAVGEPPSDPEKEMILREMGVEILPVGEDENGEVNLKELMRILAEPGIDSILLEGGGTLNAAALRAGIVKKVQVYIAPKIVGGAQAPSPVRGSGIEHMADAIGLKDVQIDRVGEDIRVTGYLNRE